MSLETWDALYVAGVIAARQHGDNWTAIGAAFNRAMTRNGVRVSHFAKRPFYEGVAREHGRTGKKAA